MDAVFAKDKIYQTLFDAAEAGDPCPSNHDLMMASGCNDSSVSTFLNSLEKRGLILRKYKPGKRLITIVETGKTITHSIAPKRIGAKEEIPDDPDAPEVAKAKIKIRRAGLNCFQAQVIGGPKGKWCVGAYDRLMGKRQLLAFAASLAKGVAA